MRSVLRSGVMLLALVFLPVRPALADCGVAQIVDLAVTMQGLRAMVETRINDRPARFVLDSGAFFSNLSPGSARDLGLSLAPAPANLRMSGIGGSVDASVATARRFTVAGNVIPNVQFLVGGSQIGDGVGLLGQNLLGLGDVEYDFAGGHVRLFRARGCGRGSNFAYWSKSGSFSIPIESLDTARRHTVGEVVLNGARIRATFDTGAPNTVVSLRAAARAGVKPGDPGVMAAGGSSGLGRKVTQGWIAPFRELDIGSEQLANVHLRMADLGPDIDMLIGADFFVSHRLYVSNAEHRIDFTFDGGRIFDAPTRAADDLVDAAATGSDQPKDAEAYSQRGAMEQTEHDPTKALADFDKAVALAPREPRYLMQRARARQAASQPVLALADYSAVLEVQPDIVEARLARARLRNAAGDRKGALDDLDMLAQQLPPKSFDRLEVGTLYTLLDAPDRAIPQYSAWISAFPDDSRRPQALNGRCWSRALSGVDLDKALDDCNAAIHAMPNNANMLGSRALVELRKGQNDRALADYDAVLALQPNRPWALYCRGIVERRLGFAEKGEADIAMAAGRAPDIVKRAQQFGIR